MNKVLVSVKMIVMCNFLNIKQLHAPSVIYADFESNLKRVQTRNKPNCMH